MNPNECLPTATQREVENGMANKMFSDQYLESMISIDDKPEEGKYL